MALSSTGNPKKPEWHFLATEGTLITIVIGPERIKYQVYKELLEHDSEFFHVRCSERWNSDVDGNPIDVKVKPIILDHIEPAVFNIFLNWLYTGEISGDERRWIEIANCAPQYDQMGELLMIKTWAFADQVLALDLRGMLTNVLVSQFLDFVPSYRTVIWAFENLSQDNSLLDLMVDVYCRCWDRTMDTWNPESYLRYELPKAFLLRLMVQMADVAQGHHDNELYLCQYHWHRSDEEQKACPDYNKDKADSEMRRRDRYLEHRLETEETEDTEDTPMH